MQKELATFAAGCFWGIEQAFALTPGVITTSVGYTGGKTENPTYEEVCSGLTYHAEAVLLEFNPEEITYQELLDLFWKIHDPTQLNRQGWDVGTQYRSAIFYHNEEQKQAAEASKKALDSSGQFKSPIVTEIIEVKPFYDAEEYHQKYWQRHPVTCHVIP